MKNFLLHPREHDELFHPLPLFTKKKKKTEQSYTFYSSNVAYHTAMPNAMEFFAKSICVSF